MSQSSMHLFDRVYLRCNRQETEICYTGGFFDYYLAEHGEWKVGDDLQLLCNHCDGNLEITEIETLFTSKYDLANCMHCGTEEIVKKGVIASNTGWVCPKCGPDEHNKGGNYGSRDIFYYPKHCTQVKDIFKENQHSLDAFIEV